MGRDRLALWSADGRGRLELSHPHLNHRNIFHCVATLVVDGEASSVGLEMATPYRSMWLDYFDAIIREQDGPPERRVWDSEFAELRLDIGEGADGLLDVHVDMQWPPTYEEQRTGVLRVRPADVVHLRASLPGFLRLPAALRR
jgi:hypothetical protein